MIGVLNVSVDILFAIEIVIFFNTSYYDSENQKYITSRKEIASNYLKGWFLLDLIAVFPFDKVVKFLHFQ